MRQLLFFITIICIISSCNKERTPESIPEQSLKIALQIQESVVTKSQPSVSEEYIKDLNLFAYDSNGSLIGFKYLENPGNEVNMDIYSSDLHSIYALANKGDMTSVSFALSNDKLDGITMVLDSPDDIAGPDGEIPMSGIVTGIDAGEKSITIPLTRMMAKFRIIVDTTGLDKDVETFEVTEVNIRRMNRLLRPFSPCGVGNMGEVFNIGATASGSDLEKLYTSGIDFYITENIHGDLLFGQKVDEQEHIPPVPFNQYCTFIEFYVNYSSKEHYNEKLIYRYYLHDGDYRNFDVRRNTMYTCRTIFNGSGLEENSWRVDLSGMKDYVTSITVSPDEIIFYELNDTRNLTASVLPASAENPDIIWSSDNENVATVTQNGTVRSVGDGSCTITASAIDGSGVKGSCRVYVYAESKRFDLKDLPDILYPGYNSPLTIEYYVYPLTTPTFSIDCLSGNEQGVRISGNVISARNPELKQGEIGQYRLSGMANGIIRNIDFSVSGGEVELDKTSGNLYQGITSRLRFDKLEPSDVELSWSTSDPSMLQIDNDGNITPLKVGRCTIKAESVTGASDMLTVNILEPYISFIDITMFEGATWTLVSSLRPVPNNLPIEYSVIKGSEYVSISGDKLYGLKRTSNPNDVIIQARLVDYPHIYTNATVTVVPAVTASLEGDNKVVNTYGHSSDGSLWNFSNYLHLDIEHAPNVSMTWEVRDEKGRLSDEIEISEDGTVNPYSSTANGKYTITGWDHLHRFRTDDIEIEVYRLLEYECGLGEYGSTTVNGRNVYVVTLVARWSNNSWNVILSNGYASGMLQQKLITYPHSSTAYRSIGSSSSPSPYIQNYTTSIPYYSTQNVISALGSLRPLSYIRNDFSTHADNTKGIDGKYYIFTSGQNNGLEGYFYIKQRNEVFFNSNEY